MRELKYRVWGVDINGEGERKMWFVPDIRDTDTSRRVFYKLEDNDVMELNPWMQYTGLKDKNGVEIYEGDIAECNYCTKHNLQIVYDAPQFRLKSVGGEACDNAHLIRINTWLKVIGNIYEHSHLLEGNQ